MVCCFQELCHRVLKGAMPSLKLIQLSQQEVKYCDVTSNDQGQTESALGALALFWRFLRRIFGKLCGMVLEYRRVQKLKTLQITLKLFT